MRQQLRKIKVKLPLVVSDLGKEKGVSPEARRASPQKGPQKPEQQIPTGETSSSVFVGV